MSAFYDRAVNTASSLLTRFGQPINIIRETVGEINPITGQVTPGTLETFTVNGVVKAIDQDLIDDSRILATDKMVVIESKAKPLMTDKIAIQGENWSIQEIQESNPAGQAIVYHVRVRL